jgi:phosphoribosylformimino-5-aminoimidazole carboxamide ribotide isomerase
VGGGVRVEKDLAELAEAGVDRVILGTVLVRAPSEAARVRARSAGGKAAAAGPSLGRHRCARGPGTGLWLAGGQRPEDLELARRARELGLGGIIYTSIARDGTLAGPDIERTNRVAEAGGLPVILSGGIGCLEDVDRVARERAEGVVGVIVGKALYEGRVDLEQLIRRFP